MHNHHEYFHFFKNRELNELYASISIRAFALSLIGVFIPVYLYQLGYSLVSIFLFYMYWSAFHVVLSVPAAKLSSRIGLKHSMLFSVPFLIGFFILLYTLDSFGWPLWLLGMFVGINTVMFWIPYHVDFAKFSNKKNRGRQIAASKIIPIISGVLGPIIGAFVLTYIGFKILFIAVSLLLMSAIIPLFFSKEIHEPVDVSFKGFFKNQKAKDIMSYIGNGMESRLGLAVWPLFIFIFILSEKYLSLGIVSSITLAVSLMSAFAVAKFSDLSRRLVLKVGIVLNSIIWVVKSFITTPLQVFFTDAFYGASQMVIHVPFDAINYDKARKNHIVRLITQREIYLHLGMIIIFGILIVFVDYLVAAFRYIGPLSSLMRWFF